MSEESVFWIGLAEKFFGVLIIILGVLLLYYTLTSMSTMNVFTGFFTALSAVFLFAGLLMILAKATE
jgi:hypothetical protein